MIRGSDGLDYENLTEKLLGNPAKTYRNSALQALRARRRPQDEIHVFIRAYDEAFDRSQVQDQSAEWAACSRADQSVLAYRVVLAYSRKRYAARTAPADQGLDRPG